MPDVYAVVFQNLDIGEDLRVRVEWDVSRLPNFNSIVRIGKSKICKYYKVKSSNIVFVSLRRM